MGLQYTEISRQNVRSGYATEALTARRFVSHATSSESQDAVATTNTAATLTRLAGVTLKDVASGAVGDIVTGGVVPVDSTAAAIATGDWLTVEQSTGKVVTAAPSAGANAQLVGKARTSVGSSGGIVMVELLPSVMQGA